MLGVNPQSCSVLLSSPAIVHANHFMIVIY
jgi:hypothetical protein